MSREPNNAALKPIDGNYGPEYSRAARRVHKRQGLHSHPHEQ